MTASFTLHASLIALVVGLGLWRASIVVAGDGTLVATADLSLRPGDPKQLESRPNTWNEPKAKAVTLRSDALSTMPSVMPRPIEAAHDLVVNGPVETTVSIDFGWHGFAPQMVIMRPPEEKLPPLEQRAQALIIKKVNPKYPRLAKRAGIQGAVVLYVIIETNGTVGDIGVVSGPEQLRAAAYEAVRQWRFQPYVLRGIEPEIRVIITLNFVLPGSRGQAPSRIL